MMKIIIFKIVVNWVMFYIEIGVFSPRNTTNYETTHYSLELSTFLLTTKYE